MTQPGETSDLKLIHVDEAAPVDISNHNAFEDWLGLVLFWALSLVVFLQFFTRYVLNDSFAWTEEIARYILIAVIFVGAAGCVRRNRHIHVDFFYRLVPPAFGRALSTFIDIVRIAFFGYATWLTWVLMGLIGNDEMTMIKVPMNAVYVFVLVGLFIATLRSVQVAWINWRQGYSALERPDAYSEVEAI